MCEKAIVHEGHPGWYNKHATGDEGRTFFGGDLGSENVIFSNLEDTLKRIWAAALDQLSGSVAEELGVLKMAMRFAWRGWLHSADLQRIWSARVASLNAAAWP